MIRIELAPDAASGWALSIADDGRGMPESARHVPPEVETGYGRQNMLARAAEIGASLDWTDLAGGGTVVRLRFQLTGATPRRRWRRRRPADFA